MKAEKRFGLESKYLISGRVFDFIYNGILNNF